MNEELPELVRAIQTDDRGAYEKLMAERKANEYETAKAIAASKVPIQQRRRTVIFKRDAPRTKFRPHTGAKQLAKAARRATKAAKGVTGNEASCIIVDDPHAPNP